jgi:KUP system potassium uptake protein
MSRPADGDVILDVDAAEKSSEEASAGDRTLGFSQAYRMKHRETTVFTRWQTVLLAYQSLGIVYGDLGTSPLYVFSSLVLPGADETDFLGVLSLIFWTLTMMSLVKYVLIVLRADDHGEGGTFALYSLLRQHVNFKGDTPVRVTRLDSDADLRFHGQKRALPSSKLHRWLEGSSKMQSAVTYFVLFGTCMMIGDGALTPAISGRHRSKCALSSHPDFSFIWFQSEYSNALFVQFFRPSKESSPDLQRYTKVIWSL